jgi:hypothetical protein
MMKTWILVFIIGAQGVYGQAMAQQDQSGPVGLATAVNQDMLVDYPAEFFERYQPNTALDMVRQVPGFLLDDGDTTRGFGAAAGNILVNDRRPSAKQDIPSAILARIPASQVARIEIIRGQVRDINLLGQSVVANIILHQDAPAAIRWETSYRYNLKHGNTYEGGVSLSDRWNSIDYNLGLDARRYARGDFGEQDTLDGSEALIEQRFDDTDTTGTRGGINLNAATWAGETLLQLNTSIAGEDRDGLRITQRVPVNPAIARREDLYGDDYRMRQAEVGIDAERSLSRYLSGKAIMLFFRQHLDVITSQQSFNAAGVETQYREADTGTITTEGIGRLEFDWSGLPDHFYQLNLEGAYNSLAGSLVQVVDTGAGPVLIDIPGANTRVEEVRADVLIKDTWSVGHFELDYGLGAEVSRISQSGDEELERNFFFLKPHAAIIYSPNQGQQTRARLAREVSQLNFNDFVSATEFEDDDLALGNPNLRPDTTWIAELGYERRFGEMSVVKATIFHHWITDVLDLLPLTTIFEVPGNIGDGRRWGVEVETTIPLDRLGLAASKLDINARWQDSSVTDPVTGQSRPLSSRTVEGAILPLAFRRENKYALTVDYRQDFRQVRMAWGWNIRMRAGRPLYKVNELDIADENTEANIFVETTRWFGVKARIVAENLTDLTETRDRTVYTGERGLSPVDFRELRERQRGFRMTFIVSGNF